jgi:hypothetical protein
VSNLVFEVLLRLAKVGAALVVAVVIYAVALALGASPSIELGLLAWVSGAVFILLVESSPI